MRTERTPESAPDRSHGLLVVISGPSGGGKTTICEQLVAVDSKVRRAVTCTTRAPRRGEREGVDYYFRDEAYFQRLLEEGKHFLESAQVHGHRYGTLKSEVLEKLHAGVDVLLSVDVQGAASIKAASQQDRELVRALVTVFIAPHSLSVLEKRLRSRGTDAKETIERRLKGARAELARWREYDYLLISATIDEDLIRIRSILDAERMRSGRIGALPELLQ